MEDVTRDPTSHTAFYVLSRVQTRVQRNLTVRITLTGILRDENTSTSADDDNCTKVPTNTVDAVLLYEPRLRILRPGRSLDHHRAGFAASFHTVYNWTYCSSDRAESKKRNEKKERKKKEKGPSQ